MCDSASGQRRIIDAVGERLKARRSSFSSTSQYGNTSARRRHPLDEAVRSGKSARRPDFDRGFRRGFDLGGGDY